jgi:hypothetical protein
MTFVGTISCRSFDGSHRFGATAETFDPVMPLSTCVLPGTLALGYEFAKAFDDSEKIHCCKK